MFDFLDSALTQVCKPMTRNESTVFVT